MPYCILYYLSRVLLKKCILIKYVIFRFLKIYSAVDNRYEITWFFKFLTPLFLSHSIEKFILDNIMKVDKIQRLNSPENRKFVTLNTKIIF